MKKIIIFSFLLVFCFAATACSLLPTLGSSAWRQAAPSGETAVPSAEPPPSETPAPQQNAMIPKAIFDSLCLPLAYIADAEFSGYYFSPGERLPSDFANLFLYQYVNAERYAERKEYGILGTREGSESVKLTAEEIERYMQSAFGPQAFQISYFIPDNYTVVADGADYYVMIGENGYSNVVYADTAPLAFSEDTAYHYALTLVEPGVTYEAEMSVWLAENAQGAYGYSIADVEIGGLREVNAPQEQQAGQADPSAPFDENGFIFPDSGQVLLTAEQVLEKTAAYPAYSQAELLGFVRNEIFARHGNAFQKEIYRNHYSQYSWYTSMDLHTVADSELNAIELENIQVILACEAMVGEP